jgi:DNA polymerase-3 subunit alpha/DNA polymerase-3 subunit epsilon
MNWPHLVQLSWITTDEDCNILSKNDHIIYPKGFIIPADAARVHGITTRMAKKKGEPLEEVLEKFEKDYDAAYFIVGHNVDFDKKIIRAELARLVKKDFILLSTKVTLCTMEISTDYCKIPGYHGYKWPKLQELHKKLFGCEFEDAHNSMSDVKATLKCFKEMRRIGLINNKP